MGAPDIGVDGGKRAPPALLAGHRLTARLLHIFLVAPGPHPRGSSPHASCARPPGPRALRPPPSAPARLCAPSRCRAPSPDAVPCCALGCPPAFFPSPHATSTGHLASPCPLKGEFSPVRGGGIVLAPLSLPTNHQLGRLDERPPRLPARWPSSRTVPPPQALFVRALPTTRPPSTSIFPSLLTVPARPFPETLFDGILYRRITCGRPGLHANSTPTRQAFCPRPPRKPPPRNAGSQRTWPSGLASREGGASREGDPSKGTHTWLIFLSGALSRMVQPMGRGQSERGARSAQCPTFPSLATARPIRGHNSRDRARTAGEHTPGRIDSNHFSPPGGGRRRWKTLAGW